MVNCENYEYDLLALALFMKEFQLQIQSFSKEDCRTYLAKRMDADINPKSISRFISVYRSFWDFLIIKKTVKTNTWKYIRAPKISQSIPHIISTEDMLNFLDGIKMDTPIGLRDRAICEALYGLGLRVSELCSLTMDQLNLKECECRIIGKRNKERIALFGEITRDILIKYINQARPVWLKSHSKTLIINKKGAPITPRSIQRIVKKHSMQQGLRQCLTPHSLRHCFASDLYKGGADLTVIKQLLGHDHLSTTEIYTHVANEELHQTIQTAHPFGIAKNKEFKKGL